MRNLFLSAALIIALWCSGRVFGFVSAFVVEHGDALTLALRRMASTDGIDAGALGLLAWTLLLMSIGMYLHSAARELRAYIAH